MTVGYLHLGRPFPTDEMGTVRCLANPEPLKRTVVAATCVDLEPGGHYKERFWREVGLILEAQGLVEDPEPGYDGGADS